MNFDDIDSFADLLTRLGSLLQGSVWLLVIAVSLLLSLRDNRRKAARKTANEGAPPVTSRTDAGSPYRTAQRSKQDAYARRAPSTAPPADRPRSVWDEPSLFDERTGDEPLKWGSAFEHRDGEQKWGFDESEWRSSFGTKKRSSEPKITTG